jgi:hypothetical protein
MAPRNHVAILTSPPALAVTVGALLVMGDFTPLAEAAPLVSLVASALAVAAAGPVLAWVMSADSRHAMARAQR